jgi:MarR family transcriptional regulator, organic hydroperoxide resistance regulator
MPPINKRTTEPGLDLRLLFSELVRLETELWNAVEGRVRKDFDVSLPVFEFLQVISRTPDCRIQDIATELAITVGGTSKIVDRIEAAGYCVRGPNPNDRRSSIIKLTPVGKRLLPRLTAAVDDELRKRLGNGASDKSLIQLTKTLTRLRAAARTGDATKTA